MSGNPDEIDSPSDVTSFGNQQLQEQREQEELNRTGRTTPKLQAVDSNGNITREIKPDVVTRFGGTKPFDTTSTQLQDGQTVVDERGDTNIRLNMEMVLTFSQFQALNQITNRANFLRVVAPSYTGKATFDQLKFDRIPDANGHVSRSGESIDEAKYSVQLQSKETEDDDSVIQPFSGD